MSLDPKLLAAILAEREQKKARREALIARRREEIREKIPEAAEIERALALSMSRMAIAALDGGETAIAPIREANQALQARRACLLEEHGYAKDYLFPPPDCPLCGDSGYIGSVPCDCLLREHAAAQKKELSALLNLRDHTFENFRLDLYSDRPEDGEGGVSPRKNMAFVLGRCRAFADRFSAQEEENLLFYGAPGLGKTFLSGCIAGQVAAGGHSVVYDTAIHLLSCKELEKFGGADEESRLTLRRIAACDLLIIDDLGSEMPTAFVASAVYSILNDRLIARRPMIVSTNLMPEMLAPRYGAQTASRLLGEFSLLPFFGEDLRPKARKKPPLAF